MGIKNFLASRVQKAGDRLAKCSALSCEQIESIENRKTEFFYKLQEFNPRDPSAVILAEKLIGMSSVEIFNAYLPQLKDLYVPVEKDAEFLSSFNPDYNIRYFNITKWVTDKDENSLEKLVNVYAVLSDEECNIALVFHRKYNTTQVYLAVTNTKNADSNTDVNRYKRQLADAIKGNFPGSEWKNDENDGSGIIPCLKNSKAYSVASASNIPAEKSEKFLSQTIEKLLDGIVPENQSQEYTLILLATPIRDIEERKLRLSELYSGLAPYSTWQTNFTYTQSDAIGSSANFGVNAGVSAGVQNGVNQSVSGSSGVTDSSSTSETNTEGSTQTDTEGSSETDTDGSTDTVTVTNSTNRSSTHTSGSGNTYTSGSSSTHTDGYGTNESVNKTTGNTTTVGVDAGFGIGDSFKIGANVSESFENSTSNGFGWNENVSDAFTNSTSSSYSTNMSNASTTGSSHSKATSAAKTVSKAIGKNVSRSIANSTSRALSNTLGRAVSKTITNTAGISKALNFGGNFGLNFARSSNITATIGNNEGITQNFTNYSIKHALELLEEQMKRYEQSTALGLWDFAAYVLSEDAAIANNVAHSYIALTQGEKSYMTNAAINLWRGDMGESSRDAREICSYLRELRHPLFGINPELVRENNDFFVYPTTVTAACSLSGKELAYSLNFPRKSVEGLPVIECAEFGRNIVSYGERNEDNECIKLGNVFHMHHIEKTTVDLDLKSLASHTFVTGSTGAGKSNTVYRILSEARRKQVKFMVIEPAKGEYKHVFGMNKDVSVYGTNPDLTPLLRLNPFSFPDGIHILEHLDRLIEIFNVCWPMYAAMPAVLKNAVEKSYEDCGWDLKRSRNVFCRNMYPSFADVSRNVKEIIESSEYDSENKGAYKGSLQTRLNSLSNGINGMIFCDKELDSVALFEENVLIDLSRTGSAETKSLIMGMLVLKLQEYRMSSGKMNSELEHITVLEEAHHLLKRSSSDLSAESGNLVGKSVEMISNAIAEMRTYGEGFIIADQAPALLDLSAIRNTNTKIIMRLPDQSDRELVGRSANLNDDQITELAKLPCGVAAVYQNEWIQPVLCKVDKYSQKTFDYSYEHSETDEKIDNAALRFRLAEILFNGEKADIDDIRMEIQPVYELIGIKPSVQAAAFRLMLNPSKETRFTKLAPIISAIFPEVYEAVKESYFESHDSAEWTYAADTAVREIYSSIDEKIRRDIIQAVITERIYVEMNRVDDLQKWAESGGLM